MAFTIDETHEVEEETERKWRCGTCKFYAEEEGWADAGRCHNKPPNPYVAGLINPDSPYKTESAAAWPLVRGTDWCGQWLAAGVDLEDVEVKREEGIEV